MRIAIWTAAAWLCVPSPHPAAPALEAAFGDAGLTGLRYNGHDFLRSGAPGTVRAVLETTGKDKDGFRSWSFEEIEAAPTRTRFDQAKRVLTQAYPWGTLAVHYAPAADRLTMDVALTVGDTRPLADFGVDLLGLAFPAKPEGLKDTGARVNGLDRPVVVQAACARGVVLACYDTIDPPARLGFSRLAGPQKNETALRLEGGVPAEGYGATTWHPHGLPRAERGKPMTLRVSLRFGPPGADPDAMTADLRTAFAKIWAWSNDWPDRRPIGMLMRSSNYKGHASEKNPRGWFWDPKIDAITPEHKAAFKAAALKDAERCVASLKAVDAQGFVFWDPEGSENPHPVTYIGDPRLAKTLAPEFDAIADDYIRVFRDAGLRTGVCIRPSQVYFDEAKKQWSHGTGSDGGPGRGDHYPQLRPQDLPWWRFYPVVERMCDKIAYAKTRWGCTLFYIDTNGVFRQFGADQKFGWSLLSAAMLKRIKERHPDVLLIPELVQGDGTYHTAYWAFAAPYFELDLGGVASPQHVRALWPKAFSIINVTDGPFEKRRAEILEGVRQGDILMVHGWWQPKVNAMVRAVYAEAKGK